MKNIKKKVSLVVGGVLSSALLASMMVAPAFAADPTYRSSTGQYTETVAYDSSVETASTEVLIDTKFHYLDYTPEIDITYKWNEDLEWTYVKNGKYGFWLRANDETSALQNMKNIMPSNWTGSSVTAFSDMNENQWYDVKTSLGGQGYKIARLIEFENNAADSVYVSFQEQAINIPSTVVTTGTQSTQISGTTLTAATSGTSNRHLEYRTMRPDTFHTETTTATADDGAKLLSTSWKIGNNATLTDYNEDNINKAIIGLSPFEGLDPSAYKPWIAENRAAAPTNAVIRSQLKLIFTKATE